jgi:pimeloyl-ACP methyl ester carboxylesterase
MNRQRAIAHIALALLAAPVASGRAVAQSRQDAAIAQSDPSPAVKPPASMDEITISSSGSRMNGIIYLAAGSEPHPVVVFLHGYPGNERNLDLAQAVRRAGYQALYIDYRGMWGSAGTFSFANGLEDVEAVLAWVRAPENVAKYRLNPKRIALVGHSMGGWLALMTGAREPRAVCIAGLAAWNIGGAALRFPAHDDERASNLDYFRKTTDPTNGPVHVGSGDLLKDMIANATAWDYRRQAAAMGDRALLLVAATRDSPDEGVAMHEQMANAVRAAGGRHVTLESYDDDHPFSSHRLALAGLLTRWLNTDCASTQNGS